MNAFESKPIIDAHDRTRGFEDTARDVESAARRRQHRDRDALQFPQYITLI